MNYISRKHIQFSLRFDSVEPLVFGEKTYNLPDGTLITLLVRLKEIRNEILKDTGVFVTFVIEELRNQIWSPVDVTLLERSEAFRRYASYNETTNLYTLHTRVYNRCMTTFNGDSIEIGTVHVNGNFIFVRRDRSFGRKGSWVQDDGRVEVLAQVDAIRVNQTRFEDIPRTYVTLAKLDGVALKAMPLDYVPEAIIEDWDLLDLPYVCIPKISYEHRVDEVKHFLEVTNKELGTNYQIVGSHELTNRISRELSYETELSEQSLRERLRSRFSEKRTEPERQRPNRYETLSQSYGRSVLETNIDNEISYTSEHATMFNATVSNTTLSIDEVFERLEERLRELQGRRSGNTED